MDGDALAGAHLFALLHLHEGVVAVRREPSAHVIDDHELAVAEQALAGVDDLAVGSSEDRLVEPAVDAKADATRGLAHDADHRADVDRPAPGRRPVRRIVRRCRAARKIRAAGLAALALPRPGRGNCRRSPGRIR